MTNEDVRNLKVGDTVVCETHCSISDNLIFFKKDFEVLKTYNCVGEVDLKCKDTGDVLKKVDLWNCRGGIITI